MEETMRTSYTLPPRHKSLLEDDNDEDADEDTNAHTDHYNNHADRTNWNDDDDDNEEIELESEEQDLFLRDEYIRPENNDVLPYKVTMSHYHQQNRNGLLRNNYSRKVSHQSNLLVNGHQHQADGRGYKIESFHLDDSGLGSSAPSSVAYQMPYYDQFASNLTPNNPSGVLISFLIIFVILTITIVPKIVPKSQSFPDDYDDDLPDTNSYSKVIAQSPTNQIVHSDVRCKCICPPLQTCPTVLSTSGNSSSTTSGGSTTNNQKNQRRLYVGNTLPGQCNCNNIVQPHYKEEASKLSLKEFCTRCECRYQSRNTTTIKRNVVFFIAVLTGLSLYLLVQYLLKHFRLTRRSLPPNLRWLSHQMTDI